MNCELVEVCYLLSCLFMDPAYVLVDVRFVINNNYNNNNDLVCIYL